VPTHSIFEPIAALAEAALAPPPAQVEPASVPQVEPRLAGAARPLPLVIVAHPEACTECEACLDACSRGAITLGDVPRIDAAVCTGCGACVTACPNGVFELAEV
jgi:ferredoxin